MLQYICLRNLPNVLLEDIGSLRDIGLGPEMGFLDPPLGVFLFVSKLLLLFFTSNQANNIDKMCPKNRIKQTIDHYLKFWAYKNSD